MSFVSAVFLFALPLAALPVAIHLYRGRQRDVIAWGAMQFLAQAVTKGRRMERLEELLLMFLRVATVLALVLALAQPMFRSSLFGTSENREVILVLDNSLSMAREVEDQSMAAQLEEKTEAILDDLGAGDRVQILLACGGPQWLTMEGISADAQGKQQLVSLLDEAKPTLGTADLLASLQAAINLEPVDSPSSRRVVLLTDNQEQSWRLDASTAWKQLQQSRSEAELPVTLELVDCEIADSPVNNLAVMSMEAPQLHARPGEKLTFLAEVENLGEEQSEEASLEWLVDDEVVRSEPLETLEPGGSTRKSVTLALKDAGHVAVTCLLDASDQISLDQQETVVVEVSDRIPILIVHDRSSDDSRNTADKLLSMALGYRGEEALKWHSVYQPQIVGYDQLPDVSLSNFRGIVITNLDDVDGDDRQRLHDFVHAGGGLWLALGDRVEAESFNRDWYDDGQGPCPLKLDSLRFAEAQDHPSSMIHPPSREHPATVQLANTTQLDIDQARVLEYWQFRSSSDRRSSTSILLEAGDGSPLVVEKYLGQGRVIVQSFPIGLEQSNLPQLKCFLVMVHDWLDYLTAPSTARHNLAPGTALIASPAIEYEGVEASLQTPGGKIVPLIVQELDGRPIARYSQTQLPGLYRASFSVGDEVAASLPFHVMRDSEESRINYLDAESHERLASLIDTSQPGDGTTVLPQVESLSRQQPLWGLLLGALVLFFAFEFLLSHWLSRQRSGVAVSTN